MPRMCDFVLERCVASFSGRADSHCIVPGHGLCDCQSVDESQGSADEKRLMVQLKGPTLKIFKGSCMIWMILDDLNLASGFDFKHSIIDLSVCFMTIQTWQWKIHPYPDGLWKCRGTCDSVTYIFGVPKKCNIELVDVLFENVTQLPSYVVFRILQ